MNGFVTTQRYSRILDVPINLAQTELRSGKTVVAAVLPLTLHQKFELRSLTITLIGILTPGVVPVYLNTAMGLCSVGLYRSGMICSPIAYALVKDETTTVNPYARWVVSTPGDYSVIVSNNTYNTDMAVAATGSVKFYY